MKTKITALIMSMLFALIFCSAVSAADIGNNSTELADTGNNSTGLADTAWPSFQGNNNHTGQSDYNGPQTNTTEWILLGSSNQNSNLAIGKDGTIYCGFRGSNYLYALYSNGTEKWKSPTSKAIMSVAIGADGTIYANDDGTNGYIYAFKDNGNNATRIWSYTTKYIKMISIGPDGTLYFGSGNGANCQLNALKDNGNGTCTLKWTFPISGMLYSPPTIGKDGTIYFGSYGYLYALRDNGNNCTLKWKYEHGNLIRCAPSIGPDGTIYFGVQGEPKGEPYTLYALKDNGDSYILKWADNVSDILTYSLAIANDGTIYVGTLKSGIMAFKDDGATNINLWTYTFTNGDLLSSPVIGADGTIYIGSGDAGDIYAFYPDGKVKWKYLLGDTILYNLAIDSNGALYVQTRASLIAFKDPAPVANFTVNITNGSVPLIVQFTDTSTGSSISYVWDFGDGQTSTLKDPTHTYTKPGTYTVKLTVTNNNGSDSDEKIETIVVVDTTKPVPSADLPSGTYNTNQTINLSATDNVDPNPKIYYTLDGSTPKTSSTQYNGPISINSEGTTTLKFIAVDETGNISDVVIETYIIDTTKPVPKADLPSGSYNTTQTVNLSATDDMDPNPKIYYTLDGTDPTTSSKLYDGPITIANTTTLKFFAVDNVGNLSPIYTEIYKIKSDVYVNITPSKTNPQVGDKVTYTFKLGNNGPGIAKDVVFTYVIPEGVEFAGANVDHGTWTYDEATRTLTWNLGDVAVGDPYLWLDLNILNTGSFNIQPLISVSGYNPGLEGNIGSLLVNTVSAPVNNDTDPVDTPEDEPTDDVDTPDNDTVTVNAAAKTNTIPTQETGVPLTDLTMALLLVGSGLALARRK